MDAAFLQTLTEYLGLVAQGRDDIPSWRTWCNDHAHELEALLGRAQSLRFKFQPRQEVPLVVAAYRLQVDGARLDTRLKRADYESWAPAQSEHAAARAYRDGNWKRGDEILVKEARALYEMVERSNANDTDAAQEFSEQVFDALSLIENGELRFGTGMLFAVASLDHRIDLIGLDIREAQNILAAIGGYHAHLTTSPERSETPEALRDAPESSLAAAAALSWLRAPSARLRTHQAVARDAVGRAEALGLTLPELTILRDRLQALRANQ